MSILDSATNAIKATENIVVGGLTSVLGGVADAVGGIFGMSDKITASKYEFTALEVGNISFSQRDKPLLKYIPQEDITPYEVSLLISLFACALMNQRYGYYDFWGYVEKHNLMRHFEEME